ncbi:DNA cytosine methyltransferase [Furfurilactobacillus rossiae]
MTNLSTREVARILKCSPQQVRNFAKNENLPFERIGKMLVFNDQEVQKWVTETGYVIEPDDHRRKSQNVPAKIALSFFTGAGGLDIGMAKAGIHPLLVNDIDKNARKSISQNYPNEALVGDVNNLTMQKVYDYARIPSNRRVDYMFGAPPCQAFSTAGKRKGFEDTRGNVFINYLELIGQIRPRYAVIENVRGLLSVPAIFNEKDKSGIKGGVLFYALQRLRTFGYTVSFDLYNSANFGAPESRERVVIIAKLGDDKVAYLKPTNDESGKFGLSKWKTFGSAVKGLPKQQSFVEYPSKRAKYLKYIPEGGNWRSLPDELQREAMGKSYALPGGKTGFLRRLARDKPSPTLVTNPTMPATDLIHPIYDRPLSVEEYSRIQGFPDSWHIEGKLTDVYKQIGNAVPVPLAKAIGERILDDDAGENYKKIKGFKYSRYKNTNDIEWESKILEEIKKSSLYTLEEILEKINHGF